MPRFAFLFTMILMGLFVAELTAPGQTLVVAPWTSIVAGTAAGAASLLDPSSSPPLTQPANPDMETYRGQGVAFDPDMSPCRGGYAAAEIR